MRPLLPVAFLVLTVASCAEPEPDEAPVVVPEAGARCGAGARLVLDVCTQLGPTDACVDVDDVCIALCDGRVSCTTVDPELRWLSGWATAPDGYCVVCTTP